MIFYRINFRLANRNFERFFLSNREDTLFDINVHKDQRFKTINQTNVIFVLKVGAKAKYFEK